MRTALRTTLRVALVLAALLVVAALVLVRDGERIIPQGEGKVELDVGEFEAFPLPDYAAAVVSDDYKSYFIEVEPGIKIHVLEIGQGYPIYLQHGNPTTGLLYRKVAELLPLDRVRVIMPTMVGLGFSTKIPAGILVEKPSPTMVGMMTLTRSKGSSSATFRYSKPVVGLPCWR